MKRFLIACLIPLAACATVGVETPAQGLYAALGGYSSALVGARAYVESPTARATIVHAIAVANHEAAPAVVVARAFRTCQTQATAIDINGASAPCISFDFSPASIRRNAIILRNAAITLGRR